MLFGFISFHVFARLLPHIHSHIVTQFSLYAKCVRSDGPTPRFFLYICERTRPSLGIGHKVTYTHAYSPHSLTYQPKFTFFKLHAHTHLPPSPPSKCTVVITTHCVIPASASPTLSSYLTTPEVDSYHPPPLTHGLCLLKQVSRNLEH